MLYPLTFEPIFQERVWGGRRLKTLFGKSLPPGQSIGESWEIADRTESASVIANGPLAGHDLHWLMENHADELLGDLPHHGRFPWLAKLLDAQADLSVQVHPPATVAAQLDGEPLGRENPRVGVGDFRRATLAPAWSWGYRPAPAASPPACARAFRTKNLRNYSAQSTFHCASTNCQ